MKKRYERNFPTLTIEEFNILKNSNVCIVGSGGLGGYVLEQLLRIGIGSITIIDYDIFEETNANRQILCTEENIGKAKVDIAKEHAKLINSDVNVSTVLAKLTNENAKYLLQGYDIIVDALDSGKDKLVLFNGARLLNIAVMHGAIQEWSLQASLIMPNDSFSLEYLYDDKSEQKNISCLAFTPAICASIQVAEVVKYLCRRECVLNGKLLHMNISTMEIQLLSL